MRKSQAAHPLYSNSSARLSSISSASCPIWALGTLLPRSPIRATSAQRSASHSPCRPPPLATLCASLLRSVAACLGSLPACMWQAPVAAPSHMHPYALGSACSVHAEGDAVPWSLHIFLPFCPLCIRMHLLSLCAAICLEYGCLVESKLRNARH